MADASDTLKQVPFFACLNDRQVKRLAGKLKQRQFLPGTSVVQEGEMSGIGFFVITEGEATVTLAGSEVGRLGPVITSASSRSSPNASARPR